MMRFLILLFVFGVFLEEVCAQIDTVQIKKEINSLKTQEDHAAYLQEIYTTDQKYRGSLTDFNIDKLNLIKSLYYFNIHGYPLRERLGRCIGAITLPYVHNSFPKVHLLSFPIIMEGYRINEIDEITFREYYLGNLYRRKFGYKQYKIDDPNNKVRNGLISDLLKILNPKTKGPINVDKVLKTYANQEEQLNDIKEIIGTWGENKQGSDVRIFIDSNGDYYYHKLYNDRSHYPQKLQLEGPLKFRLYDHYILELTSSKNYLKIYIDGKFSKALKSVL